MPPPSPRVAVVLVGRGKARVIWSHVARHLVHGFYRYNRDQFRQRLSVHLIVNELPPIYIVHVLGEDQ